MIRLIAIAHIAWSGSEKRFIHLYTGAIFLAKALFLRSSKIRCRRSFRFFALSLRSSLLRCRSFSIFPLISGFLKWIVFMFSPCLLLPDRCKTLLNLFHHLCIFFKLCLLLSDLRLRSFAHKLFIVQHAVDTGQLLFEPLFFF